MIRRSGGALDPRGDLEQQRADEVGEHGRRPRAGRAAHVAARDLDRHAVGRARRRASPRPTRPRRRTPAPAPSRASRPRSPARRCRSPSRRARRRLRARPAARATAGSSRARRCRTPARVDHDVQRALARRLPRRAHAQRADVDRHVERAPARPTRRAPRSWRRRRARRRRAARTSPSVRQLARRAVEHVLDVSSPTSRSSRPPGANAISSASTSSACSRATRTASRITRSSTSAAQPSARAARARAAAETRARPRRPARQHAGRDQPLRAGARAEQRLRAAGAVRFATTVGAHGAVVAVHVADASSTSTPLRARVAAIAARPPGRARSRSPARSRAARPRSPARRCPRPSRTAGRRGSSSPQQLQAQPRRRVRRRRRTRARVDHEIRRARRRATAGGSSMPPTAHRLQVRVPAPLPAVGRPARSRLEHRVAAERAGSRRGAAARRGRRPRTRRSRRPSRSSAPPREHRLQPRQRDLGRRARTRMPSRTRRSHPASARLSLANMPSSARRLSSVSVPASCSSRSRCLRGQPARDHDVDDDPQVARPAAPQRRHPAAAHHDRLARLRARGDVQRHVAVQRRHLDRRAQRRQRRGHVDHGHEVLAVADEALVLLDPHDDVEVAGRAAALAGVAAAGHADPLAVGDPGRDVDLTRAGSRPSRAVAGLAGLLGDPAVAAALVAQRGPHHLPEARALDGLDLAGAAAAVAGHDRRARLGAVAVAGLALRVAS